MKGLPIPPALPTAVWINPPQRTASAVAVAAAVEPVGNLERSGELSITPPPESQKGAVNTDLDRSIRL